MFAISLRPLAIVGLVVGLAGSAGHGLAATKPGSGKTAGKPADSKDAKGKDKNDVEDDFPPIADQPGIRKTFSPTEVERICHQVEGQLIAYYDDIYRVQHCHRRPVLDNKTVYKLQREGQRVQDVSEDVIAALPEGEPVDEAMSISSARGCKALEGSYVTFSNVDVYFVDHCKRHIFPDWMTYIKHREKHNDKKGEILALSWVEFNQLPAGTPIPSVVDDMFAKLLSGEAGVEVIPINEACEGLEGKVASYYSRVYHIERCQKHEITLPELYLKHLGVDKVRVVEMRSEQWLSLPNGSPIVPKPDRLPEAPKEFQPKWRTTN